MNEFPSATRGEVEKLKVLLSAPRTLAIVTHFNPDGDALGSGLGLMHVLNSLGHAAKLVLPNTPPHFLQWLPGYAEVLAFDNDPDASTRTIRDADVVFCLDFNRLDRAGGLESILDDAPVKVLIDHHQEPDAFAQVTFSDTSACSTCQMVFDVVSALGAAQHIDHDAATCLYTGIMTDSGSFRFASTTAHTHRVAAELIERGVKVDEVQNAVMDDNSEHRLRLLGFILSERLTVLPELDTAIFTLSQDDIKRFNFVPGDTEGFVNYGLTIRGIRLAAFFSERPDQIKISLRSKGDLPVNRLLADHFSGGGHRNAAGGRSLESLEDTVDRFKAVLPDLINAHPA